MSKKFTPLSQSLDSIYDNVYFMLIILVPPYA
jgi:hypothetical protein